MSPADDNNDNPWDVKGDNANSSKKPKKTEDSGPFGRGPSGNQPPEFSKVIHEFQRRFKETRTGGGGGGGGLPPQSQWTVFAGIFGLILLVWGASGFYKVEEGAIAVVLRFGKMVRTAQPGLRYRLPSPIEHEIVKKVAVVNQIDSNAHDGDADRCLAVDGQGNVIDGDHILALLAHDFKQTGKLTSDTVVSTVMANLGFKIAMKTAAINVIETGVGDRYVLEAMEAKNYVLGGEQSGHIIMRNHSTTGDGLLTALHLMNAVATSQKSLQELAGIVKKFPQVLINIPDVDKTKIGNSELVEAVKKAENSLGDKGRVLLRSSGTEALIRVMVEAETMKQAQDVAESLASVVKKTC